MAMPLAELLLIKKALKGVILFFLSKLAALIVKQVITQQLIIRYSIK
jgi:hypothetical protein